jgi:alpha-glucosidase
LGGEGSISWIDAPDGVMHFTREPGLEVVVNTNDLQVSVEVNGNAILLESAQGNEIKDGRLAIAANTTVWLQR